MQDFLYSHAQVDKYIIGAHPLRGFFAAIFHAIAGVMWAEENNKVPVIYWDHNSPYYQKTGYFGNSNAWEYYFEPISSASYLSGDEVNNLYLGHSTDPYVYDIFEHYLPSGINDVKLRVHKHFTKYLRIKPRIKKKVYDFYSTHIKGKKTIGIHLRGTDKHIEVKPVDPKLIFDQANKYNCDQYFIATDEEKLLEQAKKFLNKKVIYYPSLRSYDGFAIHYNDNFNKARLGEEVLIEAQLLSKCSKFIHTMSAVSIAVLVFNPYIENIFFK